MNMFLFLFLEPISKAAKCRLERFIVKRLAFPCLLCVMRILRILYNYYKACRCATFIKRLPFPAFLVLGAPRRRRRGIIDANECLSMSERHFVLAHAERMGRDRDSAGLLISLRDGPPLFMELRIESADLYETLACLQGCKLRNAVS